MDHSTVADAPLGATLTLESVTIAEGARRRLAELGLRPGALLTVVRRTAGAGRIVAVADSRIALDVVTARSLLVRREGAAS